VHCPRPLAQAWQVSASSTALTRGFALAAGQDIFEKTLPTLPMTT
jgi:hypothetical protein